MPEESQTIHVFVCYSHEDEMWVEDGKHGVIPWLQRSLKSKNVEFWWDRERDGGLRGGDEWRQRIVAEINLADLALLLISDSFAASEFIQKFELPRIKERYINKELSVLPVLVAPVADSNREDLSWPLGLQAVPSDRKTLIDYTENDREWLKVRSTLLDAVAYRIREHQKGIAKVRDDFAAAVAQAVNFLNSRQYDEALNFFARARHIWPQAPDLNKLEIGEKAAIDARAEIVRRKTEIERLKKEAAVKAAAEARRLAAELQAKTERLAAERKAESERLTKERKAYESRIVRHHEFQAQQVITATTGRLVSSKNVIQTTLKSSRVPPPSTPEESGIEDWTLVAVGKILCWWIFAIGTAGMADSARLIILWVSPGSSFNFLGVSFAIAGIAGIGLSELYKIEPTVARKAGKLSAIDWIVSAAFGGLWFFWIMVTPRVSLLLVAILSMASGMGMALSSFVASRRGYSHYFARLLYALALFMRSYGMMAIGYSFCWILNYFLGFILIHFGISLDESVLQTQNVTAYTPEQLLRIGVLSIGIIAFPLGCAVCNYYEGFKNSSGESTPVGKVE